MANTSTACIYWREFDIRHSTSDSVIFVPLVHLWEGNPQGANVTCTDTVIDELFTSQGQMYSLCILFSSKLVNQFPNYIVP